MMTSQAKRITNAGTRSRDQSLFYILTPKQPGRDDLFSCSLSDTSSEESYTGTLDDHADGMQLMSQSPTLGLKFKRMRKSINNRSPSRNGYKLLSIISAPNVNVINEEDVQISEQTKKEIDFPFKTVSKIPAFDRSFLNAFTAQKHPKNKYPATKRQLFY